MPNAVIGILESRCSTVVGKTASLGPTGRQSADNIVTCIPQSPISLLASLNEFWIGNKTGLRKHCEGKWLSSTAVIQHSEGKLVPSTIA